MEKMKFVLLEDARRAVLNANSKFVWCIDNLPVFTLGKNVEMVVRCKDCEFCLYNSSNDTYRCKSMRGMYRAVMADEFCSWGERKDSE